MTALQILAKALYAVQTNLVEALQISGLLWIGLLALEIIVGMFAAPVQPGAPSLPMLLLLIAKVMVGIWIAVAWHRYLILGDRPEGLLPAWNGPAIMKYLGASLIVGVALVGVGILVVALIMALPFAATPGGQMVGAVVVAQLVTAILLNLLFYRFSPVFPAAALGKAMKLRDAWAATRPVARACLWLALLTGVFLSVFTILVAGVASVGSIFGLLIELVLGWVLLMVSVSILTAIYTAAADAEAGR